MVLCFLLLRNQCPTARMHHVLFMRSCTGGHVGCCSFWLSNAAGDICAQGFTRMLDICLRFSGVYTLRSEIT